VFLPQDNGSIGRLQAQYCWYCCFMEVQISRKKLHPENILNTNIIRRKPEGICPGFFNNKKTGNTSLSIPGFIH
jgi:hypothetical protein